MKLHIDFDDDLMRKYDRRKSPLFFTIYWEGTGGFYPDEGWMDFGSVILGWWLLAAKHLVEGAQEDELPFMDGPYRLNARSLGNHIAFSGPDLDQPWQVPQEIFVHELLVGAKRVQRKLHELGLGLADQEGLKIGAVQLESAVAEQQRRKRSVVTQKQYAA